MKKTVVLMTIVLALLAAPLFAEVTIEGDVDFGWSTDFGTPEDQAKGDKMGFTSKVDDLDLDFTGTIDEFNTVTFGISWDENVRSATAGTVGSFTMKSDVTGAFGVEAPVAVTLITGYNDYFGSQAYDSATRYALDDIADRGMDKGLIIGADAVINDMVTVSFGINPILASSDGYSLTAYDKATDTETSIATDMKKNVAGNPAKMFIGAYGTFDMVTAEVYYNLNDVYKLEDAATGDYITGFPVSSLGAAANAAVPLDGMDLGVSVAVNYDMYKDMNFDGDGDGTVDTKFELTGKLEYGAGAKLTMGAFDVGVSMGGTAGQEVNVGGAKSDIDATMGVGLDAGYAVTDFLTFYGGASLKDLLADDIYFTSGAAADKGTTANAGAELGAEVAVGGADYILGYTIGGGKINNLIDMEGLFFRVKASF